MTEGAILKKTAFLFPGQGSQAIGMGLDLYNEYRAAKEVFQTAEEISGIRLSTLCFEGPLTDLTMTVNLQPALTAVNLAFMAILKKEGPDFDYTAGHSLGEYSSLFAAGIISLKDTFKLVHKRGELMHRDATANPGTMCAIIGLSIDEINEIAAEVLQRGCVSVANHNTQQQIVITGTAEQVNEVAAIASGKGARAMPLNVSGAWHSDLMKRAGADFEDFLLEVDFNTPIKPVVLNVTADFAPGSPDEIRKIMGNQLYSPVKWYDGICRLVQEKVELYVEIGPGRVLTGMLRKILPKSHTCKLYNINTIESLRAFLSENG